MTTLFRKKNRIDMRSKEERQGNRWMKINLLMLLGGPLLLWYLMSHPQQTARQEIVDQYLELHRDQQLGVILTLHRMHEIPAEAQREIAESWCRTNWSTKRVCFNSTRRG